MAHYKSMFDPTEWVGCWDLDGKDATVEITKVEAVKLPGAGEIKASKKPVISFKGTAKRLIAGAKICKAIAGMYGSDVTAWVGKKITLYPTTDRAKGGGSVECVRVRPTIPKTEAAALEGKPVDVEMQARQKAALEE